MASAAAASNLQEDDDWIVIEPFEAPQWDDDYHYVSPIEVSGTPPSLHETRQFLLQQNQLQPSSIKMLLFGSIEIHQKETIVREGFCKTGFWDVPKLLKQIRRDLTGMEIQINGQLVSVSRGVTDQDLVSLLQSLGMPAPASPKSIDVITALHKMDNEKRNSLFKFLCCIQQGAAAIGFIATKDHIDFHRMDVLQGLKKARVNGVFSPDHTTVEIESDLILVLKDSEETQPITVCVSLNLENGSAEITWKNDLPKP